MRRIVLLRLRGFVLGHIVFQKRQSRGNLLSEIVLKYYAYPSFSKLSDTSISRLSPVFAKSGKSWEKVGEKSGKSWEAILLIIGGHYEKEKLQGSM